MNKPSPIAASSASMAAPARCDLSAVEAGGETFRFRTVDCESCCRGSQTRVDDGGFYEVACGECHRGKVDASCADCMVVKPVNDEGFCEACALADVLSPEEWNARFRPFGVIANLHRVVISNAKEVW